MKKGLSVFCLVIVIGLFPMAGIGSAKDEVQDITEEVLVGPGSVSIATNKDIRMSFGGLVRIIPTSEDNWDFGMSKEVPSFLGGMLKDSFFNNHFNESGNVTNSYIRTETKLYFNAMPKDRKWTFYAALEFDRPIENATVDNRGGKAAESSNFGLERLHGTMALGKNLRFHAGWDIWEMDVYKGGSLVYADDNPGFWLTGGSGDFKFNLGYFKLMENDFQNSVAVLDDDENNDRSLFAGFVDYDFNETNTVRFMYAYDRIRKIGVNDFLGAVTGGQMGINGSPEPKVDSHHVSAYYIGNFGPLELLVQGAYQFGDADDTGLAQDDFDIDAYAFTCDLTYELKEAVGFGFKPHLGLLYTSGDDDPDDDTLGGYQGVSNPQRFSPRWGGENTILGDTNFTMGTMLYSFLPEIHGNGTPVLTGGVQNTAGMGGGRGDNPGLTMVSLGLKAAPKRFLIYRTNINYLIWNEDFVVTSFMDGQTRTKVDSGYAGTEWDNEITLALSKSTFIKGQFSFLFPGDGVEDVTTALSGSKADKLASRLAAEFIWNF
ncbi:MAG: hypothetical protein GY737_09715 [Desulfobacteraceae bacterium]|nr:hypothetical protein [Desulfobacteraceae bacterium]